MGELGHRGEASGGPRHGHASHKQPSCADCWREEAGAERERADRAEARANDYHRDCTMFQQGRELVALRAEVDRLTEALREITEAMTEADMEDAIQRARALAADPEGGSPDEG